MIPAQLHLLNLVGDRLANISIINGYNFNIEKIKREKISNFTGKELPIIFYWSENDTRLEGRTSTELRRLPVFIAAFFRTRDNIFNDDSLELGFDIYTALHRNPSAPNLTDESVIDLGCDFVDSMTVDEITPIIGQGESPFAGVILSVVIDYSFKPGIMTFEDLCNVG